MQTVKIAEAQGGRSLDPGFSASRSPDPDQEHSGRKEPEMVTRRFQRSLTHQLAKPKVANIPLIPKLVVILGSALNCLCPKL